MQRPRTSQHCACGKQLAARNSTGRCQPCHIRQLSRDPSVVAARARTYSSNRLGWCPVEYRATYFRLNQIFGYKATEARAMVEQQIATDAARYARTGHLQQSRRAA